MTSRENKSDKTQDYYRQYLQEGYTIIRGAVSSMFGGGESGASLRRKCDAVRNDGFTVHVDTLTRQLGDSQAPSDLLHAARDVKSRLTTEIDTAIKTAFGTSGPAFQVLSDQYWLRLKTGKSETKQHADAYFHKKTHPEYYYCGLCPHKIKEETKEGSQSLPAPDKDKHWWCDSCQNYRLAENATAWVLHKKGCSTLAVLPGSHRSHCWGNGETKTELPGKLFSAEESLGHKFVAIDAEEGDLVLFHANLVHCSVPIDTAGSRVSTDIRCARKPVGDKSNMSSPAIIKIFEETDSKWRQRVLSLAKKTETLFRDNKGSSFVADQRVNCLFIWSLLDPIVPGLFPPDLFQKTWCQNLFTSDTKLLDLEVDELHFAESWREKPFNLAGLRTTDSKYEAAAVADSKKRKRVSDAPKSDEKGDEKTMVDVDDSDQKTDTAGGKGLKLNYSEHSSSSASNKRWKASQKASQVWQMRTNELVFAWFQDPVAGEVLLDRFMTELPDSDYGSLEMRERRVYFLTHAIYLLTIWGNRPPRSFSRFKSVMSLLAAEPLFSWETVNLEVTAEILSCRVIAAQYGFMEAQSELTSARSFIERKWEYGTLYPRNLKDKNYGIYHLDFLMAFVIALSLRLVGSL